MVQIYHNNRCSKSRETLEILNGRGQQVEVVEYIKEVPTAAKLKELLQKLRMKPEQIVRKGESVYKEQFAGKSYSDDEWIDILVANPILIERPIVVNGDKAVIGRPPENVLTIL